MRNKCVVEKVCWRVRNISITSHLPKKVKIFKTDSSDKYKFKHVLVKFKVNISRIKTNSCKKIRQEGFSTLQPIQGNLASPPLLILIYLFFLESTVIPIERIYMGFYSFGVGKNLEIQIREPKEEVIQHRIVRMTWLTEECSSLRRSSSLVSL